MRTGSSVLAVLLFAFPLGAQQLSPSEKARAQLHLPPSRMAPDAPLSARERVVQLLNRFSYGARPGEIDRVLALGTDKWLAQQLQPASVGDASAEAALRAYPTLTLTPQQEIVVFPTDNYVRQVAEGKRPTPADPLLASLYQVQVYRYQSLLTDANHHPVVLTEEDKAAEKKRDQASATRTLGTLLTLPRRERIAVFNAMPVADRLTFAENIPPDQRTAFLADLNPREREMLLAMQTSNSSGRIGDELAQAKIVRSILTERSLQDVMTDFWFNHFNIFVPKDSDQWYGTTYERDTIRPHVLGRFRDLLLATAQSPAMMIYLDNWLSVGPNSLANGVNSANPKSKPGNKGLNENYGREVMELHTVGVSGGYTQADVTHLAAILTGWGVDDPGHGGGFLFDPRRHEPGTKQWFGYTLDEQGNVLAGPRPTAQVQAYLQTSSAPMGMKQGVAALALLAASPRTAHFLSYLLAQRFLADEPPPALVDRLAQTYLVSDGDIATVLRALIASREFNSHRFFRNKVKTPYEFLASAFRATMTDPQAPGALVGVLSNTFGEPPYRALPPTGYYITADHWMNTQSLLARLNFADQLTHNKFANQKFDSSRVLALALLADHGASVTAGPAGGRQALPRVSQVSAGGRSRAGEVVGADTRAADSLSAETLGADTALRVLENALIGGELSPNTESFIRTQLAQANPATPTDTLNLLTALLLGSPEFQVR